MAHTKIHTISALVENKPGVLNRVASLIRRRGFNIDSLTVGRTHRAEVSRMTIVISGTDREAAQVEENLYKLVNVIQVEHLTDKPSIMRDLALIKVSVDKATRGEVMQLCDIYRANIVDVSIDSVVIEVTGDEGKLDSFTNMLRSFKIIEMVRTGVVAMGRGHSELSKNAYKPARVENVRRVV